MRGREVANSGGYISAFNLYVYIYETVLEAVEELVHKKQEPELTVLTGVGPFAVSLFRGASSFGAFNEAEPAPDLPAVRQVKPEKAERLMNNLIGGTVNQRNVNTGGGAYIEGNVDTGGGDFVGRDKTVYGSESRDRGDEKKRRSS